MKNPSIFQTRSAVSLIAIIFFMTSHQSRAQDQRSIRLYAHPGFDYFSNKQLNSSSPYFRGGPLVLFVTNQITEKVSVAGEMNLHYMAATGAEMELERMYLKYDWKPALAFRVGRMYSPIGYWNSSYNFGLVLQPNISRPRILNPTHDGGFIQTRETGLQLEGENLGAARFFYRMLFANGIGKNGGLQGVPYALGKNLSYTMQLGIEPADGLQISASASINQQDAGSSTQYTDQLVPEKMKTLLIAASLSYMNIEKKGEFIAEYFYNQHDYSTLADKALSGAIVYAGYKATSKIVPYVFVELLQFPDDDPYYPAVNEYTGQKYMDTDEYNLGIRYKASANLVLKLEGAALYQKDFDWSYGFKTQVAVGF